jgi:hypothetical protein
VKGLEIRDAHFPGRAPLDAYGDGGFRFAEMSHRGSLLCVPSGIYGWNLTTPAEFSLEAFERVIEEQPDIEVLLVGTGPDLCRSAPISRGRSGKQAFSPIRCRLVQLFGHTTFSCLRDAPLLLLFWQWTKSSHNSI